MLKKGTAEIVWLVKQGVASRIRRKCAFEHTSQTTTNNKNPLAKFNKAKPLWMTELN